MRPAASSSDFAGGTCLSATGMRLVKMGTEKTADPIFQNRLEWPRPAKILLRGPANYPEPGGLAKTHRDRNRPELCIAVGLRCHRDRRYRPLPAEVRFPAEPRSDP